MHQLHLLRHAKSGREGGVADEERPLTRRGIEAARLVGERLPAAVGRIDLVLCSPALRTRQTADLVLAGFDPRPELAVEDGLYLAGRAGLVRRLRRLAEGLGAVMLVGHNPALYELAVWLAAPDSPRYRALAGGKFPTTARASFAIAGTWAAVDSEQHVLVDYVTPKSLVEGG